MPLPLPVATTLSLPLPPLHFEVLEEDDLILPSLFYALHFEGQDPQEAEALTSGRVRTRRELESLVHRTPEGFFLLLEPTAFPGPWQEHHAYLKRGEGPPTLDLYRRGEDGYILWQVREDTFTPLQAAHLLEDFFLTGARPLYKPRVLFK